MSCPRGILDNLRAWAERAVTLGVGKEFASDLRAVHEKLATEPLVWGEPRFTLPSGQGHVYQGAVRLFHVTYSVHEAARVVFIIDVGLMPNAALAQVDRGRRSDQPSSSAITNATRMLFLVQTIGYLIGSGYMNDRHACGCAGRFA